MKFKKLIIVSTIVCAFAGQFSTLIARDAIDERLYEEAKPLVEKVPEGFFVEAPGISNLVVMIVRVIDNQGEQIMNVRSVGEAVDLYSADLSDGEYHYEVKTIFHLDSPSGEGPLRKTEGVVRESGSFYIERNEVFQADDRLGDEFDEQLGFIDFVGNAALTALGNTLDILIPSANAASVDSSPNGVFRMESDAPYYIIYHNNDTASSDGRQQWWRWYYYDTDVGSTDSQGLELRDEQTDNTIIDVQKGTGNDNAVQYFGNGDIRWGNGSMTLDKSLTRLNLGTISGGVAQLNIFGDRPNISLNHEIDNEAAIFDLEQGEVSILTSPTGVAPWHKAFVLEVDAPTESFTIGGSGNIGLGTGNPVMPLHIVDPIEATMRLESTEFEGEYFDLTADYRSFFIKTSGHRKPFTIWWSAPTDSLFIDAFGEIGIGTNNPDAAVHVVRSDGRAKILVEEENVTAAPRTLFQLKNKGNTKFGVLNTEAGVEWAFANPGTGFRLSRQGSGVVEMEILNNGNMKISGTLTELSDIDAKTAITEIDPEEILSLVSTLPLHQWEYKDARGEAHIGPMAQDFYAAFGLGASETGIATIDTAGVALAAIKALHAENKTLKQQNASMQVQNIDLIKRLEKLERQQSDMQLMMAIFIKAGQSPVVLANTTMN